MPGCLSCNSASGELGSSLGGLGALEILTMRAGVEESFALDDQAPNLGIVSVHSVDVHRSMG